MCARPTGVAAQPDHGDMTTANAESGQIRPANKPGRGRLQHTAFVVAMGAQPVGLLEVDAKLRWRGVRWLSRIPRGRGAERHRAHRRRPCVNFRPLFVSRDCIMSSGILLRTPYKGALLQRSALKTTEIRPWCSYAVLAQFNR